MVSVEFLRRYHYFAPIDRESLEQVASFTEEKCFPAGTTLFNEHDPADTLFVIVHGKVDISYVLGTGENRVVDTLMDGDLLVWSALVEPYRTTGIGVTAVDTQLLAIDAARLRQWCDRDPELGRRLMGRIIKLLANRLIGARVQLSTV